MYKKCFTGFVFLTTLMRANPLIANDIITNEFNVQPDGQGDWAIAMSGGGLRSSIYMAGALRALEEKKLVSNAQSISSVSGGSYTAYWLYNLHHRNDKGVNQFGSSSIFPNIFPKRICEFMTSGNFVTNVQIARNLITGNSVRLYRRAIIRTYGTGDSYSADGGNQPLLLSDFKIETDAKLIPEPIINATIHKPKPVTPNHAVLEFTPNGLTNSKMGSVPWSTELIKQLPYNNITAISGAAVGPLKQKISNTFGDINSSKIKVWDGGKSENLGAFALIRRGIKNVIIIDAEHDPKFKYNAYSVLVNKLKDEGIQLSIEAIEKGLKKRPRTSFFKGTAKGKFSDQNIYYIKMGLPETLDEIFTEQSNTNSVGAKQQETFLQALNDSSSSSNAKIWDCNNLVVEPFSMAEWSAYNTSKYAVYLNKRNFKARVFNASGINFLKLRFPHYSTIDQSFYRDQTRAYIGLGYLQASEFAETISIK